MDAVRYKDVDRYYFHIVDDMEALDEEGLDLPGDAAAREAAISGARGILAEGVLVGVLDLNGFIRVEDHRRQPLFTVSFGEVVEVRYPRDQLIQ